MNASQQKEILLKLSVGELDHIANVLGQRPYTEVKNLIDKFVMQANDPVLQSFGPPPETAKDTPATPT